MYNSYSCLKSITFVKAANILLGIIALIIAFLFIRNIISLTSASAPSHPLISKSAVRSSTQHTQSFQEYGIIFKNNPFGFPAGEFKMLSGDRIGASARSDIKLIGTISGSQQQGYAIFLNNNSQQEVVKTGESVTGIGTLKEVLKDKVVIQGAEGIDEIPFAEINVVEDGSRQQGKNVGAGTISPSFVKSMGGGAYLVDQKSILHALDKPNQLMTDARLQPNMVSGRQEGFVLREVKGGGIYHTLGLQNGDVLLRINSMDISSPDSALQAFTALRGMDRVNLDIIRNGSRMTLNYQMR